MSQVMTVRDLGSAGACGCETAGVARDRMTMSIGFSKWVMLVSTFCTCCWEEEDCGRGVCSFMLVSVISARGVAFLALGSGEAVGSGVGRIWEAVRSGASSVTDTETRLFLAARTVLTLRRFGGEAAFVGDGASSMSTSISMTLSGGLNICDGSTDSDARVRRVRVAVRGVAVTSFTILRRVVFCTGAGVFSSSSFSSWTLWLMLLWSSSSESTTCLRREAMRLEGRTGDSADIAPVYLTLLTRWICL